MNPGIGFGLRSASGESGAKGGEARIANRSRSATPAAAPQTEARRACGTQPMQACDERAICGMWSEGSGATPARKSRVGHGGLLIRTRAVPKWSLEDAGKRLVLGFGKIIQAELDGARIVAEAERAEDSIPHR